jgi:hypothetical protein
VTSSPMVRRVMVVRPPALSQRATAPHQAHNQGHDEDDHEEEKEYLRDTCRGHGNTPKPKQGRDQRNHQEDERPIMHGISF